MCDAWTWDNPLCRRILCSFSPSSAPFASSHHQLCHIVSVDASGNIVLYCLVLAGAFCLSLTPYSTIPVTPLFAFCSSASLLVLYTASTLYHSFFALMVTRYVFEVLDKCAIYILIAGSYTPYLQICLHDKPKWSVYLLAFIWLCAIMGVSVEACFPAWKHKPKFSLSMYLGMGWACMVCMPDLIGVVPPITLYLVVMGGVAYTGGVPFFIRNNNLDHSVWHLFVLAGSVFHWFGVYIIAK